MKIHLRSEGGQIYITHLMAVQGKEELEGLLEEDLHGRVEERHSQKSSVRTILDCQNIVRHFESPHMDQSELFRLVLYQLSDSRRCRARRTATHNGLDSQSTDDLLASSSLFHLEVPELDIFIGTTADQPSSIGSHVYTPNRSVVSLVRRKQRRGSDVVQKKLP